MEIATFVFFLSHRRSAIAKKINFSLIAERKLLLLKTKVPIVGRQSQKKFQKAMLTPVRSSCP